MRFVKCFAVVYSGCKCPTGDGYQSTTHGWNMGRVVRVVGGADCSPPRVCVGGLAKVWYPQVI